MPVTPAAAAPPQPERGAAKMPAVSVLLPGPAGAKWNEPTRVSWHVEGEDINFTAAVPGHPSVRYTTDQDSPTGSRASAAWNAIAGSRLLEQDNPGFSGPTRGFVETRNIDENGAGDMPARVTFDVGALAGAQRAAVEGLQQLALDGVQNKLGYGGVHGPWER